jgi:hypothetical protein
MRPAVRTAAVADIADATVRPLSYARDKQQRAGRYLQARLVGSGESWSVAKEPGSAVTPDRDHRFRRAARARERPA